MKNNVRCGYCKTKNWITSENCIRCKENLRQWKVAEPDFHVDTPESNSLAKGHIIVAFIAILIVAGGLFLWKSNGEEKKLDSVAKVPLGQLKKWDVSAPGENLIKEAIDKQINRHSLKIHIKGKIKWDNACYAGDDTLGQKPLLYGRDPVTHVPRRSEMMVTCFQSGPPPHRPAPSINEDDSEPDIFEQKYSEVTSYEIVTAKIDKFSYAEMYELARDALPNLPPDYIYYAAKVILVHTEHHSKAFSGPGKKGRTGDINRSTPTSSKIIVGLVWDETASAWKASKFPSEVLDSFFRDGWMLAPNN